MSAYINVELSSNRKDSLFSHIDGFLNTKNSGSVTSRAYSICCHREECGTRAITKHVGSNITVNTGLNKSVHTSHGPEPEKVLAVKKLASLKCKAVENPEASPA